MVQILHHARAHQQGIDHRPRPRRVLQQAEFERKPVAMRFEKRIYSASVSVKISPVARGDNLLRRFGCEPQPQNPLLAVHLHRVFADHFRKFSGSGAPHHVHLPQPVLRGDVSLRKK